MSELSVMTSPLLWTLVSFQLVMGDPRMANVENAWRYAFSTALVAVPAAD